MARLPSAALPGCVHGAGYVHLRRGGHFVRDGQRAIETTRAIVVDEFALVRLGVTAVLEPLGIEVIAESHSGRELVSIVGGEQPDLVVIGTPADLPLVDVVERL